MINLTIRGNGGKRVNRIIEDPTQTIRQVLEQNDFPTVGVGYNLNGDYYNNVSVLDKSFADLGITGGTAFLMAVKNADNA